MNPTTAPIGPGTQLGGRYQLHTPIGRGGVGQVWEADDPRLQRRVAVKTIAHDADDQLRRFEREVRTLATLNHRSIVTIHDAGQHQGTAYLVMELVEGSSLADQLADSPLEANRAVAIAASIADALDVAHGAGIIHRDVKPGNILLDADGTAKLADFGIARLAETSTTVTMVGTAAYLAPEQLQGGDLTDAADIYALGLVLLEMLTGTRTFEGTAAAVAYARLERDPEVPAHLPADLRDLLRRMTARDPAARPSADQVVARLRGQSVPDDTLPLDSEPTTVAVDPARTGRSRQRSGLPGSAPADALRGASDRLRRWWRSISVRWTVGGLVAVVLVVALAVLATTASSPPADGGADTAPESRQQLPAELEDGLSRLEQEINR